MSLIRPRPVPVLEGYRQLSHHPRPDDPFHYGLASSVHLEGADPTGQLIAELRAALDRLDAVDALEAEVLADPEAWFRAFVSVSHGTWVIPRDVIERLAALRANIWVDAI
jgi:hypothetical protein